MRKARGDAKLKTLPDALQEELWQQLRRNTQEKVIAWLSSAHGVDTTASALSVFFNWYPRQGWLRQSVDFADSLKASIAKLPELQVSAEQASKLAQLAFELQAARDKDADLFLALQKGRNNANKLKLDERRVVILEKKAAEADKGREVAADDDLTPEEQLSRFKQIFGGK